MAQEIERKFLVTDCAFKKLALPIYYKQGYIPTVNGETVRVRIAGDKAFITLKTHTQGISRNEYEYQIPVDDAIEMLDLMCAKPQIEKYRYKIPTEDGLFWEVDEFLGLNKGLIIAEIELPSETAPFTKPNWVGEEVSGDKRYYNSYLCTHPYNLWK